jgi:hypothetical protein
MSLPPPPISDPQGSFAWLEWYRKLRDYVSTSGSVPWYIINFAGSKITDIADRSHNNLQSLQGGSSGEMYHLTAAQYAAIGVGNHNDLAGLQGGSAGEYYHLTTTEHTALTGSVQGTWNPAFTSLTEVPGTGSITKSGRYSRLGRTVFFTVTISCTGDATTASTAGTTYCDLPVAASIGDTCSTGDLTTNLSVGNGVVNATTDRIYPASWTATGNTITISGKYEV